MLMAVKNQIKVILLSIRYAIMREMLNRTTFLTNILFMILNNACFIVQWLVLYSIQENIGGYTFTQILLLWGFAASSYGFSHFFFENAYHLADTITEGKLDAYMVQPKNILLSTITSGVKTSALGDMIYGYLMLIFAKASLLDWILFTGLSILGGIVLTALAVIVGSFSFYFTKADWIVDSVNGWMTSFATYPDGIFKGIVKVLLFTLVPVGIVSYIPVYLVMSFRLDLFCIILLFTGGILALAFLVFYHGIRRYSSGNLMSTRM